MGKTFKKQKRKKKKQKKTGKQKKKKRAYSRSVEVSPSAEPIVKLTESPVRALLPEQKEERKQKALKLADELGVDFSTACQVLDSGLSYEEYKARSEQRKEKRREYRREKWEWFRNVDDLGNKYLKEHAKAKTEMFFSLHNGSFAVGRLDGVSPFRVQIATRGRRKSIEKLELQFCCEAKDIAAAQKGTALTKKVASQNLRIPRKRSDRYQLDEKALERAIEREAPVSLTVCGGESMTGTVKWISDYEIMLDVGGAQTLVFKHALNDVTIRRKKKRTGEEEDG